MSEPIQISTLLQSYPGLVLADEHDNPLIAQYLTRQMPELSKAGVKLLFMEMFNDTPEHRQWLASFNAGDDSHNGNMRQWLDKKWHYAPRTTDDYMQLLESARSSGIAIVGMEPPSRDPFKPVDKSNQDWQATIDRTLKEHPGAKYAVFGGRLHTQRANDDYDGCGADQAKGIDTRLGIPCVTFASVPSTHNKTAEIHRAGEQVYCAYLPARRAAMGEAVRTP